MDKEIDIKKVVKAAGYTGKQGAAIAATLSWVKRLSDIENAYTRTPNKINGEDKWQLLKKLRDAAVQPEPAPKPAPAPAKEKEEAKSEAEG